jgi:hypothetical protein
VAPFHIEAIFEARAVAPEIGWIEAAFAAAPGRAIRVVIARFTSCISAKGPMTSRDCLRRPAGNARLLPSPSVGYRPRSYSTLWLLYGDEAALTERP